MAFLGGTIDEKAVEDFMKLKFGKDYDFLFLGRREDFSAIETKHIEPKNDSLSNEEKFEKLRGMLPKDHALYVIFSFAYELKEGGKRDKLMMMSWVPSEATQKDKMVHASSKVSLKRKLEGVGEESVHASEISHLDYTEILKDISKGGAVGV